MNILLGVTGSIAAYKAVDLVRLFQKNGHQVSVIMTRNATRFVAPLTFATFCPQKTYWEAFAENQDPLLHLHLCEENDLLLVAPATANIIAKMSCGSADDLLSTICLAFAKRVVIAPAMNTRMWDHAAVRENVARLKSRGVEVIEPEEGSLACQSEGKGRLPAIEIIYNRCLEILHV